MTKRLPVVRECIAKVPNQELTKRAKCFSFFFFSLLSLDGLAPYCVNLSRWFTHETAAFSTEHSLLAEAEKAIQELEVGVSLVKEQVQEVGAKKLAKIASQAQQQQLMDALQAKTIHGVFMKTSRKPTRDFERTHLWLRRGKQRAETEALVVAAQDGVIMTRAYQSRVLKEVSQPYVQKVPQDA